MTSYSAFFVVLLILSFPALAQSKEPYVDLPDDFVAKASAEIRSHLYKFKLSETEFVGKETPEQLAEPLLTPQEAEAVLVRGIISVTAEWCGYDWNSKSFLPFMQEMRSQGKSEKQMAFIGGLHGFGMGMMEKAFSQKKCDNPAIKEKLERYFY